MGVAEPIGQVGSLGDVVVLSRGQPKPQWIAQRIDADMNFGGKSTPTTPQGLIGLSTSGFGCSCGAGMGTHNRAINHQVLQIWLVSNIGPHFFQIPCSHQRAKRLYTLFHFPKLVGSKRHCAPLRIIHSTPSTKRRHGTS